MKEKSPNVSIIIPTYNRADTVGRSVKSVLDQSYKDFEIIIVDDGSSDNTEEIIRQFQKHDDRIRFIRHSNNKGAGAARNTGIKASGGRYIAFQDSDDTWEPEKLEKQIQLFEQVPTEVGVIYTDMWKWQAGKRKYLPAPEIKPEEGIIYHQSLTRVMGIGIQTVLMKKECFKLAGMFDESLPRFIDLELFIRLSKHVSFCHIQEPLINYYYDGNRISGNDQALVEANELILKKYAHDLVKDKRMLATFQYRMASILCQSSNNSPWRGYLLKAVKADPVNIKYLAAVFASMFGKKVYNKFVNLWLEFQYANAGYNKE